MNERRPDGRGNRLYLLVLPTPSARPPPHYLCPLSLRLAHSLSSSTPLPVSPSLQPFTNLYLLTASLLFPAAAVGCLTHPSSDHQSRWMDFVLPDQFIPTRSENVLTCNNTVICIHNTIKSREDQVFVVVWINYCMEILLVCVDCRPLVTGFRMQPLTALYSEDGRIEIT